MVCGEYVSASEVEPAALLDKSLFAVVWVLIEIRCLKVLSVTLSLGPCHLWYPNELLAQLAILSNFLSKCAVKYEM